MRILLWHGYLLGGTGSNVYTRQLARRMVPRGSRRHRPEPGAAAGDVRPRRRRDGPPRRGGLPPGVRARPLRGIRRRAAPPGLLPRASWTWVEANAAASGSSSCRPRVHEPRPARRPGWRRLGAPFRRQGARVGARILDARETRAGELGRGGACGGAATFVGSEHIRAVVEDVCGHTDRVFEVPPGRRRRAVAPRGARRGARAARRRGGARPAESRQRRRAAAGRWERWHGSRAFLAGDRPTVVYFGKLIEQKGVDVLLEALRGLDARVVIVGFGPERPRSKLWPRRTGSGALHRAARAPPPAAPARPRRRVRRAVGIPRGVRHGRRRGGGRRLPAVVSRHSGLAEVAAGLEEALPGELAPLVAFPTGDVAALRERLTTLLALAADDRELCAGHRATSRRGAVELGGDRSAAARGSRVEQRG